MPEATTEIRRLEQSRNELHVQARAQLDGIPEDATDEQVEAAHRKFDQIMEDADKLEERAKRYRRLPGAEDDPDADTRGNPNLPDHDGEDPDPDQEGREYGQIFFDWLAHGNDGLNARDRAILRENRGFVPGRDGESRALESATAAAGGVLLPTTTSTAIYEKLKAYGPMYDPGITGELVTTNGNPIVLPTVDDTTENVEDHAESAKMTERTPAFGSVTLNAYARDSKIVKIPLEFLQDAPQNMETFIANLLSKNLGRSINTWLTTADGSNKPNGIVNASSEGVEAAGAAAITADELIDFQHSIDPAYRALGSRWMFNDNTLRYLRKLKNTDGDYIFQAARLSEGAPATLLDWPFSINQAMADIGANAKSVLGGAFQEFIVRKVLGISVTVLRELYAENLQIGLFAWMRIDSDIMEASAVKHIAHPAS